MIQNSKAPRCALFLPITLWGNHISTCWNGCWGKLHTLGGLYCFAVGGTDHTKCFGHFRYCRWVTRDGPTWKSRCKNDYQETTVVVILCNFAAVEYSTHTGSRHSLTLTLEGEKVHERYPVGMMLDVNLCFSWMSVRVSLRLVVMPIFLQNPAW